LNLSYLRDSGELQVLDVKNKNTKNRNEAIDEALAIAEYIQRNNVRDAYIITPFVAQKEMIQKALKAKGIDGVKCGTIHSIQGAESDTIILSTALSQKTSKNTFKWLKNNSELLNVAITRAKNKLIIATDTEILNVLSDTKDDLYQLVDYAKNNGDLVVAPSESTKIEIGKSNASVAEDEFFKTISHFCSCHRKFEADRNVRLDKIIEVVPNSNLSKMEFDLVLYEKTFFGKKPVIAFEVNGGEHFGQIARERADRRKMELCKQNDIILIMIPNTFVKAYEYIADIIMSLKNKSPILQQSIFDL
jgi:superfamily I DNA and/or RNA helicase